MSSRRIFCPRFKSTRIVIIARQACELQRTHSTLFRALERVARVLEPLCGCRGWTPRFFISPQTASRNHDPARDRAFWLICVRESRRDPGCNRATPGNPRGNYKIRSGCHWAACKTSARCLGADLNAGQPRQCSNNSSYQRYPRHRRALGDGTSATEIEERNARTIDAARCSGACAKHQSKEIIGVRRGGCLTMNSVSQNLEHVREQIAQAAVKAGRAVEDIELVAITKTHPAEKVREAVEARQNLFGESRVQEARAKIPLLPSNLRWHFGGHLQKHKIRHALPLFELFHSVDSIALAQEMNRIADEEGMHPRVLLEVNVAGEGSKFGFAPEKLHKQMESLLALPRLSIEGLMTIPPLAEEAEASRRFFLQLRELRDALEKEFDLKLPRLSMGMTNDFTVAIEEGATLVRVGTAIFG